MVAAPLLSRPRFAPAAPTLFSLSLAITGTTATACSSETEQLDESPPVQLRSATQDDALVSVDFESGKIPDNWQVHRASISTRAGWESDYGLRLKRRGHAMLPVDTSGRTALSLAFDYRVRGTMDIDVASSPDGPWTTVVGVASRYWEHKELPLPDELSNTGQIWIRFTLCNKDRWAYIDNVAISGARLGTPCFTDADCSDTDACNGNEVCSDGLCRDGTPVVCDDGEDCNGVETCLDGGCLAGRPMNCDDGNDCNGEETCEAGSCVLGTPVECDDGLACNGLEVCQDGECVDGDPVDCPVHETCDSAGECVTWNDPDPAPTLGTGVLDHAGPAQIAFESAIGQALLAYTYRPTNFDPATGRILFVIHGNGRTAEAAMYAAAPIAERHDVLIVAPWYPEIFYEDSEDFSLGVGVGRLPTPGVYDPNEWLHSQEFTHAEVEHVFEALRAHFGGTQTGYYLFGHSAGAQFVHRLLTFLPNYRVLRAAASSAGWYTLPMSGSLDDDNLLFPYGLTATPWEASDMSDLFAAPFSLLIGELETDGPDDVPDLRSTPQAMAQGTSRMDRAHNYYRVASTRADELGLPFHWNFDEVAGASHDKDELMPSGAYYLFENTEAGPCTPSRAEQAPGLVINELLADPASGSNGDANADGTRDSADDEFVEIVNTGDETVCLTGWNLSDGDAAERHRFPIGSSIEPGHALVVFGGGVPTGRFGESRVQWVSHSSSLNLTNNGDVLTLSDATGTVHSAVSWGHCDDHPCADEHIDGDLGFDRSAVRVPEFTGEFVEHPDTRQSPGVRTDGTEFDAPPPPPPPPE